MEFVVNEIFQKEGPPQEELLARLLLECMKEAVAKDAGCSLPTAIGRRQG